MPGCNSCGCEIAIHQDMEQPPAEANPLKMVYRLCPDCKKVCIEAPLTAAPTPTPAPTVTAVQDTRALAEDAAHAFHRIAAEQFAREARLPAVLIRAAEGGFILQNKFGKEAVAADVEGALAKARAWLNGTG
mgnify:CR=1 FL=1